MRGSGRRSGWWGLGLVFAVAACFSESGIGDGGGPATSTTEGAGTVSPGTGGMTMADGPSTVDGPASDGAATTADGTSGPEPMTSGAGTATEPTATADAGSTTEPTATADTGAMSATDDGPSGCQAGGCTACLICARDEGGPCGEQDMDCSLDVGCSTAVNQLQYCESQAGQEMCCPPVPNDEEADKLWACLQPECGDVCHCLMGG